MDPFLGEVRPVGFNFAPQGWALCQGQTMAISQNTALFALLGTTYGGNGQTTFALPNLQGQVALSSGQGPGLQMYDLGQIGGEPTVLLTTLELPAHNHQVAALSTAATSATPVASFPAKTTKNLYDAASTGTMEPSAVIPDGDGQPHNNIQPYLTINYIIAMSGIFPQRS